MENAPLVSAQTHARKAAQETAKVRLGVASTEHSLAAEDYLSAANDTDDAEALRIFKLLEVEHHKLAQILKAKDEFKRKNATDTKDAAADETEHPTSSGRDSTAGPTASAAPERSTPPTLHKTRNTPSSLAKDIASRRGIPQSQPRRPITSTANISPVQASGRMVHSSRTRLSDDAPPFDKASAHTQTHSSAPSPADEGFNRFYSSLVNGPFSKLSSMLAFASLPLHETSPETSPSASRVQPTTTDVTSLISKAALTALDSNTRFGPGESFYVVPPSYAAMAARRNGEEFLDAREHPLPTSIVHGQGGAGNGAPTQTLREEELSTENAALKQILDRLSQRLAAFESHAQDASIALAQSVISTGGRHGEALPAAGLAAHAGEATGSESEAVRSLQARLDSEVKQREALTKENQRNKQIIAKYRSHWEQLKDSARARREKGDGGMAGKDAGHGKT